MKASTIMEAFNDTYRSELQLINVRNKFFAFCNNYITFGMRNQ